MEPIGILALQGAFSEHEQALSRLQAPWREIRSLRDLEKPLDGLILPGGESTVMGKLLRETGLFAPIVRAIGNGLPVFGTCAGLILLARKLSSGESPHLATLPVTVSRNAYGRQLGSFFTTGKFLGALIPMTFIRAPKIETVEEDVSVLCSLGGTAVAVQKENQLACAFHPELGGSLTVHRYFLERMVKNQPAAPACVSFPAV